MSQSRGIDRRRFLQAGGGALAALALAEARRPGDGRTPHALVGAGRDAVGSFGVPMVRDYSDRVDLYSPHGGFRVAFHGTRGRLEAWIHERPTWPYDELRLSEDSGRTGLVRVRRGGGRNGRGEPGAPLLDRLFRDRTAPDPWRQVAGARDGAMAVLLGLATSESLRRGEPVAVASLDGLEPRVVPAS